MSDALRQMMGDLKRGRAMPDRRVLDDVADERRRQTALGFVGDHPDGIGDALRAVPLPSVEAVRALCDADTTWALVLLEEVLEAFDARDEAEMRAELVQVAAVAVRWVAMLDARGER